MSADAKFTVAHVENGIDAAQVSDIQKEIEQIMLLTPEEFNAEEKKLLRKVSRAL